MDKKINKYLQQIGALCLLLLFVEYIGGSTLFSHNHTIDGQTIVHSHLYSGSPDKPDHNHTQQQVKLIAALSNIVVLAAVTFLFAAARRRVVYNIVIGDVALRSKSIECHHPLRAPPSFI